MTNAELQKFFPLHSRVLLKSCPHGEPGTVIGFDRGKILACFRDLDLTGRHTPDRLLLVEGSAAENANSKTDTLQNPLHFAGVIEEAI
ncbi:MAG: hypothetical protein WCE63_23270 [Acidobacteriaceae bacterium]